MTRAVLLALVVSTLASGQTITTPVALAIRSTIDGSDTQAISASQCSATLTVQWIYTQGVSQPPTSSVKLWATDGACQDSGPGANDKRFDDVSYVTVIGLRTGQFNVKVAELPGFAAGTTTPCGAQNITKTHRICGNYSYLVGTTTQTQSASPMKLIYDTQPPTAPIITSIDAQDASARVHFTVDSDAATVSVEVRGPGETSWTGKGSGSAAAGWVRVTGLTNNTTYDVRISAADLVGNVSPVSDPVPVTPIHTVGFWGAYRAAGGTDQGGCAAAGGGPLLAAAVLMLLVRRRVR